MAAADILVMAVYFSGLLIASRSEALKKIFPAPELRHQVDFSVRASANHGTQPKKPQDLGSKAGHAVALICVGYFLTKLSNFLAKMIPFPGASTGTLCLATLALLSIASVVSPEQKWRPVAKPLARQLLNIFFAAIGASARFSDIMGIGTPILGLTSIALLVHSFAIGSLTFIVNKLLKTEISLAELLVASNANIGGPSTAAAFAGGLPSPSGGHSGGGGDEQGGLVGPATAAGSIGYAIATSLGVAFASIMRKILSIE
uniref:Uncharacterized protein n=2 Tax=Heterosigma akashiwo TaxID=2829 RepID=A0A7S3XRP3_HETAK